MKTNTGKKSFIRLLFVLGAALTVCCLAPTAFAAETAQAAATASGSNGLGLIAAALSTGLAGIGSGIAVASGAPAAIGALTEDAKTFGKSLIFVALGEGIALYGMLISILILNKI
ncbi:MAG: ATP synthase subunit C [Oscillospiraceae bacterium]|nr:ATP synthase subunit C [Oscillospiraceae bacterium]